MLHEFRRAGTAPARRAVHPGQEGRELQVAPPAMKASQMPPELQKEPAIRNGPHGT